MIRNELREKKKRALAGSNKGDPSQISGEADFPMLSVISNLEELAQYKAQQDVRKYHKIFNWLKDWLLRRL